VALSAGFLPTRPVEPVVLGAAFVLAFPLAVGFLIKLGQHFPFDPSAGQHDLIGWERDRILALAKGTGASAAGFLTALAVALLSNDIRAGVSGLSILGCLAGAIGFLCCAAWMNAGLKVSP
jgi:hypothetical protein